MKDNMTRLEYLKSPEMSLVRKNINTCAIMGYVIAVLSFGINYFMYQSLSGIFDAVLIVVCSLLIQLLQSRVASIILMVYAVLNVVVVVIQTGRLGGWWIAIVGIYAIIYTFKFQKAWKAHKNGGAVDINLPQ
jgi:hypothetical protein